MLDPPQHLLRQLAVARCSTLVGEMAQVSIHISLAFRNGETGRDVARIRQRIATLLSNAKGVGKGIRPPSEELGHFPGGLEVTLRVERLIRMGLLALRL